MVLFLILFLIAVLSGIGYALYALPRWLGYKRIGQWLLTCYAASLTIFILLSFFEDGLFSKNDARKMLTKQKLNLQDDFKILRNSSETLPNGNYHIFILKISGKDKISLSAQLKNSRLFAIEKVTKEAKDSANWCDAFGPYDFGIPNPDCFQRYHYYKQNTPESGDTNYYITLTNTGDTVIFEEVY